MRVLMGRREGLIENREILGLCAVPIEKMRGSTQSSRIKKKKNTTASDLLMREMETGIALAGNDL